MDYKHKVNQRQKASVRKSDRPPNRIREMRTKAGLTQQQLADKSGVNRVTIAKLESQTHAPSKDTLNSLSQALGVDKDVLSGRKKESAYVRTAEKLPEKTDYYLCALTITIGRARIKSYAVMWFDRSKRKFYETKPDGTMADECWDTDAWSPLPEYTEKPW